MVEQRRMNCGDQLNVKYINDFSSRKTFGFPVFPRRCELMQICEGAPGLALCYARPKRALEVLGCAEIEPTAYVYMLYTASQNIPTT